MVANYWYRSKATSWEDDCDIHNVVLFQADKNVTILKDASTYSVIYNAIKDMLVIKGSGVITFFDLSKGVDDIQRICSIDAPNYTFTDDMALNPAGLLLAIQRQDRKIAWYRISAQEKPKEITCLKTTFKWGENFVDTMLFSPDGTLLAMTATSLKLPGEINSLAIELWDVSSLDNIHKVKEDVTDFSADSFYRRLAHMRLAFTHDGKQFITSAHQNDYEVAIWDLSQGAKHAKKIKIMTVSGRIEDLACSRAQDRFAIILATGAIRFFKTDVSEFRFKQALLIYYAQQQKDGCTAISSSPEHVKKIYETFTKEQKKELKNIFKS